MFGILGDVFIRDLDFLMIRMPNKKKEDKIELQEKQNKNSVKIGLSIRNLNWQDIKLLIQIKTQMGCVYVCISCLYTLLYGSLLIICGTRPTYLKPIKNNVLW